MILKSMMIDIFIKIVLMILIHYVNVAVSMKIAIQVCTYLMKELFVKVVMIDIIVLVEFVMKFL